MYRIVFFVVFILFGSKSLKAQVKLIGTKTQRTASINQNDSTFSKKAKGFKDVATIDKYILINQDKDTTVVDTTISIKKEYKYNYLQKDNFGLMPFANIGQTYNELSYNTSNNNISPLFGSRARHFNYLEIEDIKHYEVPTPWTRLTYKTAFEQGQLLDAFFTVNLTKQFNFAIAYKALRSLGNYQNVLTSSGNFRFVTSYKSKNQRYNANAHIVTQDLLNQENGGIRDEDVQNFVSGNEEFLDRSVFDPNFQNAENILVGKRFYLNQEYKILKKKDSLNKNTLSLKNTIFFEDKYFEYNQDSPTTSFFGDAFTTVVRDRVTLENFQTELGLDYNNNLIGNLQFHINYNDINYGYNSIVLLQNNTIPNRIKNNYLGVKASYSKNINKFNISGEAKLNLSEQFSGNYIGGELKYKIKDNLKIAGGLNISSTLPNYNYLLYQNDYINYNWYNFDTYKNINKQTIYFKVKSKKYADLDLDISNINNYTYFNLESTTDQGIKIIKPNQYQSTIQYIKLKASKEIKYRNFALDNTIMYQNVISDDNVLNVPALITRNTLYYSNQLFKKAMTLQTGIIFNYFTEYNMNAYDPVLAEFYTQNQTKLGGFPRLDFFVNAKIRQTRIFIKAEHFNSSFTGYNYFSAPNQPYRDFTVRFGLVWDFFL